VSLQVQIDERGIAHVTLDRPERHNAFDEALIAALTEAFTGFAAAPPRAVVLSGAGKSFCAGGDLGWMKRAAQWSEAENEADGLKLSAMLASIDGCPAPVIASVHGPVYGGGVGLVACADMAVAAPNTRFRLSEVRLGLTPATISPFVIAAIGARQARRWFLTAEEFGVEAALDMGLVNAVADDRDAQVAAWIAALADCAPGAVADAKALVRDFAGLPVTDTLRADSARRIAARRASAEGREGLEAFFEKRKPAWASHA
jgi:methylglutaconyl-CoA hydratase